VRGAASGRAGRRGLCGPGRVRDPGEHHLSGACRPGRQPARHLPCPAAARLQPGVGAAASFQRHPGVGPGRRARDPAHRPVPAASRRSVPDRARDQQRAARRPLSPRRTKRSRIARARIIAPR